MDSFILGEDIKVVCLTAKSFPEGIENAHAQLHEMLPKKEGRRFFGISRPNEKGVIIYKAAADIMEPHEVEIPGLQTFTIRRGAYNTYYIIDYRNNIEAISRSFNLLLGQAEADPNGYCLEWYIGDKDVKCMVLSGPEDYPVENHTIR